MRVRRLNRNMPSGKGAPKDDRPSQSHVEQTKEADNADVFVSKQESPKHSPQRQTPRKRPREKARRPDHCTSSAPLAANINARQKGTAALPAGRVFSTSDSSSNARPPRSATEEHSAPQLLSKSLKEKDSIIEDCIQHLTLPRAFPMNDTLTYTSEWVSRGNLNGRVVFKRWELFDVLAYQALREVLSRRRSHPDEWAFTGRQFASACRDLLEKRFDRKGQVAELTRKVFRATMESARILDEISESSSAQEPLTQRPQMKFSHVLYSENLPQGHSMKRPVTVKPAYQFFFGEEEYLTEVLPSAVAEFTASEMMPSEISPQKESSRMCTWTALVDELNEIFKGTSASRNIHKAIGQTICSTLHCRSGHGFLYNHMHALFIKVHPDKNGTQVIVNISRRYDCDDKARPSTFPALIAFFRAALRSANDKMTFENTVRCAKIFSRNGDKAEPVYSKGKYPNGGQRSARWVEWWSVANQPVIRNGITVYVDNVAQRLARFNYKGPGSRRHITGPTDTLELHSPYETGQEVQKSYIRTCVENWEDDQLIETIYNKCNGLAGSGAGGIVRSSVIEGKSVAVKYWNRDEEMMRVSHRNEMLMYCWLASTHPGVMGKAIPNLVAVGMQEWVGAVLVTELVGLSVCNDGGGKLKVGKQTVNDGEVKNIEKAAVKSIRMLHACGVVHGDPDLGNLRVEKILKVEGNTEEHVGNWRAWWIDLGTAQIATDSKEFAIEEEHCRQLFKAQTA